MYISEDVDTDFGRYQVDTKSLFKIHFSEEIISCSADSLKI